MIFKLSPCFVSASLLALAVGSCAPGNEMLPTDSTIPTACVDLVNKSPGTLFAAAIGTTKNNQQSCYLRSLKQPVAQMCEDSFSSFYSPIAYLRPLMDGVLEYCLNDGSRDCKLAFTSLGVARDGRIVQPFGASSPIAPVIRQTSRRSLHISEATFSKFEGVWATTDREDMIKENPSYDWTKDDPDFLKKHANACTDPDARFRLSRQPLGNLLLKNITYFPNLYKTRLDNSKSPYSEEEMILESNGDGVMVAESIGNRGSCADELSLTDSQFYRKYPDLGDAAFRLKQQRDKNQSDADFDRETHYRVTTTQSWKLVSTNEIDVTDRTELDPEAKPSTVPTRWRRCE